MQASVVAAHGLSCSAACGIFLGQGPNLCSLHWQADSYPMRHQGSPQLPLKNTLFLGLNYLFALGIDKVSGVCVYKK